MSKSRPTLDAELLARVAKIAKVPEAKREIFGRFVISAVQEAWRGHASTGKHYTQKDILPYLSGLKKALTQLQPGQPGEGAGAIFGAVIAPASVERLVDQVTHAEDFTRKKFRNRGAPSGTQGRAAFDMLCHMTVPMAVSVGGDFTCYRDSRVDKASGSFPKFLDALPLPAGFVPSSGGAIVRAFNRAKQCATMIHPTK